MEHAGMADGSDGFGAGTVGGAGIVGAGAVGGPAPELAVRGTGPGRITVGGLAADGGALLIFVSEHCPTSALALRRLGPLCQAWAQAGLAAIAIFEDPLDLAIRTARRLGWSGQVAAQDPPYPASRAYRSACWARRARDSAPSWRCRPRPSRSASRAVLRRQPSTRSWRRRCPARAAA